MQCPFCKFEDSKVIDSRPADDGKKIRRRRECESCKGRFTTYEEIETIPLIVVKKDHSRQIFDRKKLLNRFLRACGKRPVSIEVLEKAIDRIHSILSDRYKKEVTSSEIAELAMQELKNIDLVAYIRFVSVYEEFSSIDEFMQVIKRLG